MISRRTLLAAAATATVAQALPAFAASPAADADHVDRAGAEAFINRWNTAWNQHDAVALGALHTDDQVTINRFGTVVDGRVAVTKALAFLHSADGPFGKTDFPPQTILSLRQIAPGVMSLQTVWRNPVMHANGKIDPDTTNKDSWNDMIVSFVLVQRGSEWKAADVDAHNVEKMDLPFSNLGQKN